MMTRVAYSALHLLACNSRACILPSGLALMSQAGWDCGYGTSTGGLVQRQPRLARPALLPDLHGGGR